MMVLGPTVRGILGEGVPLGTADPFTFIVEVGSIDIGVSVTEVIELLDVVL